MRLTDANSIVEYIEEMKTPDAPLVAKIVLDNIELFIKNIPTIEAVSVEDVARMICTVTSLLPCALSTFHFYDKDEWCAVHCYGGLCDKTEKQECWTHAIKEGWLDGNAKIPG